MVGVITAAVEQGSERTLVAAVERLEFDIVVNVFENQIGIAFERNDDGGNWSRLPGRSARSCNRWCGQRPRGLNIRRKY